jgi:hypothetical protein
VAIEGVEISRNTTTQVHTAGSIELGDVSDTTLTRTGAGAVAIEGVQIARNTTGQAHTAGTYEVGDASDTTLGRTAAGILSVEGIPVASGAISATTGNTTLALTDSCKVVEVLNSTAPTITIPPNGTVAFPVGTYINLVQMGSGVVTITTGTGVSLNGRNGKRTAGQYAMATIYKTTTDTWLIGGDTQV